MISNFRFMYPDFRDGIDGEADYERDVLTLDLPSGPAEFSLSHVRHVLNKPYHITEPEGGWRREFSEYEKSALRPIAETLAMLDGNAFFTVSHSNDREWFEGYLPEASAVFESNGGFAGWAGEASFVNKMTQR